MIDLLILIAGLGNYKKPRIFRQSSFFTIIQSSIDSMAQITEIDEPTYDKTYERSLKSK